MTDETYRKVAEGTIDDGKGNKTFLQITFVQEGPDKTNIHDWAAHLTIDNTTQAVPLTVFLKLCEVCESVRADATKAGIT